MLSCAMFICMCIHNCVLKSDVYMCAGLSEHTVYAQSLPQLALSPYTFGPSHHHHWHEQTLRSAATGRYALSTVRCCLSSCTDKHASCVQAACPVVNGMLCYSNHGVLCDDDAYVYSSHQQLSDACRPGCTDKSWPSHDSGTEASVVLRPPIAML